MKLAKYLSVSAGSVDFGTVDMVQSKTSQPRKVATEAKVLATQGIENVSCTNAALYMDTLYMSHILSRGIVCRVQFDYMLYNQASNLASNLLFHQLTQEHAQELVSDAYCRTNSTVFLCESDSDIGQRRHDPPTVPPVGMYRLRSACVAYHRTT